MIATDIAIEYKFNYFPQLDPLTYIEEKLSISSYMPFEIENNCTISPNNDYYKNFNISKIYTPEEKQNIISFFRDIPYYNACLDSSFEDFFSELKQILYDEDNSAQPNRSSFIGLYHFLEKNNLDFQFTVDMSYNGDVYIQNKKENKFNYIHFINENLASFVFIENRPDNTQKKISGIDFISNIRDI